MAPRRYRVVQWATGNIGTRSLRAVLEHPELELVGVRVFSARKDGVDAGELCGLPPTGVAATCDPGEVLALRPDCVLYMADRLDVDALCQLLGSGINVVATRSELHRPAEVDETVRRRLEEACRSGGATLHSTGSSPGFITEALPLALSSLERRVDEVTIDEFADLSSRDSPELLFDLMGFGRAPGDFDPSGRAAHGRASFGGSLGVVADAWGLPLDEVVGSGAAAVATRDVTVAAGTVSAGNVAAQRMEAIGLREGRPLLRFRANWYLTTDLDPAWELRETGWRIRVAGDLPLDVGISFPVSPDEWAATSPGITAHRAVNAVPYVCAAEPGLRTSVELPQIVPWFGPSQAAPGRS